MADTHAQQDFVLSSASIHAGLAQYAVGFETAEGHEHFLANASNRTKRLITLMVEKCESEARAYLERYEPDLSGDDDILVSLECHLADTWEQWCEDETTVISIAEQWIATNVEE